MLEPDAAPMVRGRSRDGLENFSRVYGPDYERATRALVFEFLRPGMVVIDAGAHLGLFTILAASRVGPNGVVWAFEPDPYYFEQLSINVADSGFGGWIRLHRVAVSDRDRAGALYLGNGNSSSLFRGPTQTGRREPVSVVGLDSFLSRPERCVEEAHLIKLDIEGSEPHALRGMRRIVEGSPDLLLVVELNPGFLEAAGSDEKELLDILREFGFDVVRVLDDGRSDARFELSRPADVEAVIEIARNRGYVNLATCRTP